MNLVDLKQRGRHAVRANKNLSGRAKLGQGQERESVAGLSFYFKV